MPKTRNNDVKRPRERAGCSTREKLSFSRQQEEESTELQIYFFCVCSPLSSCIFTPPTILCSSWCFGRVVFPRSCLARSGVLSIVCIRAEERQGRSRESADEARATDADDDCDIPGDGAAGDVGGRRRRRRRRWRGVAAEGTRRRGAERGAGPRALLALSKPCIVLLSLFFLMLLLKLRVEFGLTLRRCII